MSKKLYELFFESTQISYAIREAARLIGVSPMTARKNLNLLAEQSLLIKQKKRLTVEYRANLENPLFRFDAQCYFVKKLFLTGLIEYIEKELSFPKAIYLFGSLSKGEAIEFSDVDLFVVSSEKKQLNLKKFEKTLKREINLFVYSEKELKEIKEKNPELLNNMLNGVKVYGYVEVFSRK